MSITFKSPMLAVALLPPSVEHTNDNILAAMKKLRYPVLASLKMDGVRALRLNGSLLSRSLKTIHNKSIRERSLVMPGGFDMELWCEGMEYNDIQSIVMSAEHPDSDKVGFYVLDWYQTNCGYLQRLHNIDVWALTNKSEAKIMPVNCATNFDMLLSFFTDAESKHSEGICFRTPNSPYKFGRSTLAEQYLVKLCRYHTAEAKIVGFEEQMANCNKAKWNNAGKMDRGHSLSKMKGKNTLGAFIVMNETGQQFSIGTGSGLTNSVRDRIWFDRHSYLGKIITFTHKGFGMKVLPRSPSFKGFRDKRDL